MADNAKAIDTAQSAVPASDTKSTAFSVAADLESKDDKHKVAILKAELLKEKEAHMATKNELQLLTDKLKTVIQNANEERKKAAHRGNRFKTKYKNLLSLFDAVLPGTKEVISQKILTTNEKQKKLKNLEETIAIQKKNIDSMVEYDHDSQRDIYQAGFGKEYEKLKGLIERRKKLDSAKSY